MDIKNIIIKNTGANAVGRFFDMAMLIIITPIIYKYLGRELFGLWSIVFILSGYFTFLDFGISQSYIKFVAEYHAKNDILSINKILSTGLFFYLLVSMALFGLVYVNLDNIVSRLFKIPGDYCNIAKISILLAFGVMCISNIFSCFFGLLNGMQRMELRNIITIITRIINFAGVLLVVNRNWGILGLTINASIGIVAGMFLAFFAAIKIFPQLKISLFLVDKEIFKRLASYGYKLQVVLISDVILNSSVQIMISNILGLTYVGYYTIGLRAASALLIIPGFLLAALIPAFSGLYTKEKRALIDNIYEKSSKYLIVLGSWLIFGSSAIIPYVFFLWLGVQNPELSNTFYAVTIAVGFNIALTGAGSSVVRGIGFVEYEMYRYLIKSGMVILLGVLFTKHIGFSGLLLVIFIADVISSIYFRLRFKKLNIAKTIPIFGKTILIPFLLGLALFGVFKCIHIIFGLNNLSRMMAAGYIALFGAIFSFLYLFFVFLFGYFTPGEIDDIKNITKRLLP